MGNAKCEMKMENATACVQSISIFKFVRSNIWNGNWQTANGNYLFN